LLLMTRNLHHYNNQIRYYSAEFFFIYVEKLKSVVC